MTVPSRVLLGKNVNWTLLNKNVALVLELVDFNALSANKPKFAALIIYPAFVQNAF